VADGDGAEYFYGFFGAGVSQWYPPLWENSTPTKAEKTPDEGYHFEADMADKAIAFINRQKSSRLRHRRARTAWPQVR
jgi:arylsulfatase A-like enzyme